MVNFKEFMRKQGVNAVIIFTLCGVLLFLYQQSERVNVESFYHMESLVDKILFQDAELEKDMTLLLAGQLAHFDTLVRGMDDLDALRISIDEAAAGIPSLSSSLNQLHIVLDQQKEPMERFKMQLSIYLNSARYLPTLLEQVQHEYPQHLGILLSVYHEVQHLVTQRGEFDDVKIRNLMAQMHAPELKPIVQHLQLILEQYQGLERAFYAFIHCGVDDAVTMVSTDYKDWFNQGLVKADKFRLLLMWFAILLLAYVAIVLWRLRGSNDALKKSHAFLHFLQKGLDDHAVVSIANSDGDITYVNDKFCEVSGYAREEVIGENHRILKTEEHAPGFFAQMWATITSGETWHGVLKNKRKDGSFYWVDTTITPFLNDDGKPWQYVAIRTNITQQIEIEQSLKESHERYRTLSELTPFALGIVQNGAWVYVNQAALNIFGVTSAEQLLHQSIQCVVPHEYQESLMQRLKTSCDQQQPMKLQEFQLQTMDGKSFDAEIQGAPFRWHGERAILLVIHDITERKAEAEVKQAYQEKMEHTQRLESLGVLAGGIAHDFNNILTAIMGNTALAVTHVEEPQVLVQNLDKIKAASMRAAELCEQMLMYAGGGVTDKQPVLLHELLHDVMNMVRATLTNQITLEEDIAADILPVEADIRQVQQVMLNLLTNAAEAIEEAGVIRVKLGVTTIDGDETQDWVGEQKLVRGQYVFLEVSDTGCGMDRQTKAKIFEPFFTTKFTGRGLGMSALLGIIHAHDGAIAVDSEKGKGTTIRVLFPAVEADVVAPEMHAVSDTSATKVSGKVLLIDDEPDILEFAAAVLEDVGFEVVTANNGEEAIAQYQAHQQTLTLVVCDMVMPKLGGVAVAKHIHAHTPNMPVLLSSGYDERSLDKSSQSDIAGFIRKPYMPETLVDSIVTVLNAAKE
ncbi:PAS domain S-box protein [Ghiorsea bivora]|uniref:PAS domain S-box protein n=1 Tax=Ghiorsea bivora TaxID=1485545 RepID=UPI00068C8BC1|nr:PAS domain S-box protein [Ghiorsea bivora]